MRQKIVAGNWKMNLDSFESKELVNNIAAEIQNNSMTGVKLIVIPSFVYLNGVVNDLSDSKISVGAQDVSYHDKGAYTGEVSVEMIKSIGVQYCLLGHSERRIYHNENNENLSIKLKLLLEADITPIFCIGETISERESNSHFKIIEEQLKVVFELDEKAFGEIILAYEPVWAIGTGLTASPEQAQEMHSFIRGKVEGRYSNLQAQNVSILYGGSCKANNAKSIFDKEDVDGGLIGGASLNAKEFIEIAKSFS